MALYCNLHAKAMSVCMFLESMSLCMSLGMSLKGMSLSMFLKGMNMQTMCYYSITLLQLVILRPILQCECD